MSYCRWSHKSDVYVYQADDGAYVVNVRGTTADESSQSLDTLTERIEKAYLTGELWRINAMKEQWRVDVQGIEWKPLESKYAGDTDNVLACATYSTESLEELADLLMDMHNDGVRVPREVFASIHSEISHSMERG